MWKMTKTFSTKRLKTEKLEHKANLYKKKETIKVEQQQQKKELKDYNDNKQI